MKWLKKVLWIFGKGKCNVDVRRLSSLFSTNRDELAANSKRHRDVLRTADIAWPPAHDRVLRDCDTFLVDVGDTTHNELTELSAMTLEAMSTTKPPEHVQAEQEYALETMVRAERSKIPKHDFSPKKVAPTPMVEPGAGSESFLVSDGICEFDIDEILAGIEHEPEDLAIHPQTYFPSDISMSDAFLKELEKNKAMGKLGKIKRFLGMK